jgi:hypothetical protein
MLHRPHAKSEHWGFSAILVAEASVHAFTSGFQRIHFSAPFHKCADVSEARNIYVTPICSLFATALLSIHPEVDPINLGVNR